MNKKEILAAKVVKTRKKGKMLTSQVIAGTLILYFFKDSQLQVIYAINIDEEKRSTYYPKTNSWKINKLVTACGYESVYGTYRFTKEVKFSVKKYENIALSYLEKHDLGKYLKNALDRINTIESSWDRHNRYEAFQRKIDRIEKLMDEVPLLPDDFRMWSDNLLFQNKRYLFWDKSKKTYYCSACGHNHTGKYKHNEIAVCPNENIQVIVKKRQYAVVETAKAGIIQEMANGQRVARYFTVEKIDETDGCYIKAYEEIRFVFGGKKDKVFYGQRSRADEDWQKWFDTNGCNKKTDRCFMYDDISAINGTRYEHIGIQEFVKSKKCIDYNKLMYNAENIPYMEYLLKGKLLNLADEICSRLSYYSFDVSIFLTPVFNKYGKTASEVLKINSQRIARLRQMDGGIVALKWLQIEEQSNKKVNQNTISFFHKVGIDPQDIKFILDRMSPEQIKNYLLKQKETVFLETKTYEDILNTWKDYLDMANQLHKNINDSLIFKPTNLATRHFEVIEELNQKNIDEVAAEKEQKFPDVAKVYKDISGKYEYENRGYVIIAPQGIRDIISDSRYLHHCAANSDRYYDRIQSQETYILFLRKKSAPKTPFVTLEVQPNGTVRQKRMFDDKEAPENIVSFIKEWQKAIQNRLTEDDKRRNEISDKARIENMKNLKNEKPKLYGLLEKDFLEAEKGKNINVWIYVKDKEDTNGISSDYNK